MQYLITYWHNVLRILYLLCTCYHCISCWPQFFPKQGSFMFVPLVQHCSILALSPIQIFHPWGHELRYPSAMVAGPLRLLRWFVWSCWWRVVSPVLDILMSLAPKISCQSARFLGRSFYVAKFVWVLLKCCRLFIFVHALFDCCPKPRLCLFELASTYDDWSLPKSFQHQ